MLSNVITLKKFVFYSIPYWLSNDTTLTQFGQKSDDKINGTK
jgi:hypothetical protein